MHSEFPKAMWHLLPSHASLTAKCWILFMTMNFCDSYTYFILIYCHESFWQLYLRHSYSWPWTFATAIPTSFLFTAINFCDSYTYVIYRVVDIQRISRPQQNRISIQETSKCSHLNKRRPLSRTCIIEVAKLYEEGPRDRMNGEWNTGTKGDKGGRESKRLDQEEEIVTVRSQRHL
jgi:hypothetical protein